MTRQMPSENMQAHLECPDDAMDYRPSSAAARRRVDQFSGQIDGRDRSDEPRRTDRDSDVIVAYATCAQTGGETDTSPWRACRMVGPSTWTGWLCLLLAAGLARGYRAGAPGRRRRPRLKRVAITDNS